MFRCISIKLCLFLGLFCTSTFATDLKIAFLVSNFQQDTLKDAGNVFTAEARKLNFTPILVDCQNSAELQKSKVIELIEQKVNALIIQRVHPQSPEIATMAAKAKIPIIAFDSLLLNSQVDAYVTADSFQAGVLQAEAAVKATNGSGNYLILAGEKGHSVVTDMVLGIESVLKKHPKIKVVATEYHDDWGFASGRNATDRVLKQKNLQAILANNSLLARRAIRAVQADKNLVTKPFIAGSDADLASLRELSDGREQLEIWKDLSAMAKVAANVAFQLASGKTLENGVRVTDGSFTFVKYTQPVKAITKSNFEAELFETGIYKKSDYLNLPPRTN